MGGIIWSKNYYLNIKFIGMENYYKMVMENKLLWYKYFLKSYSVGGFFYI